MSFKLGLVNTDPDSEDIRNLIDNLESDEDDALSNYSPVGSDGDYSDLNEDIEIREVRSNSPVVASASGIESSTTESNALLKEFGVIDLVDSENDEPPKKIFRKSHKGRLLDPVWEKYSVEHDRKGNRTSASCRACGMRYKAPKSDRLIKHLESCQKKQHLIQNNGSTSVIKKPAMSTAVRSGEEPIGSSGVGNDDTLVDVIIPGSSQLTIPKMFKQKADISEQIDVQIGRFVCSSLVPFQIVENPEFISLMKLLRPSYVPPSAKSVSNAILNRLYDEVTSQVSSSSEGRFATIMQDGWTGQHGSPIISHSLNLDGKATQFLNATNAQNERKTTEYCLSLLIKSIDEAESKYKCVIGAVVTDNTNSMVSMRAKLQDRKPHILAYGCNVHLFNLVGKDFISKDISDEVKKIQHYFKDHTKPRETLKLLNAKQPIIPCDTRWNSYYACLSNFMENHSAYIQIAKTDKDMNVTIKEKVMNLQFFTKVKEQRDLASPIVDAIDKLQADYSTVADAVWYWIRIRENCFKMMDNSCQRRFTDRMDFALEPFVCAAYLLNPKYKGKGLGVKYTSRGQDWLSKKSVLYVAAQVKLSLNDTDIYPSPMLNEELLGREGISPAQWWKQVGSLMSNRIPAGLSELSENLMMLPASTSGIERCFSTMGNIMTDIRNRIGLEKAAKLCMINRYLKVNHSK